jgi:hypothetical protein
MARTFRGFRPGHTRRSAWAIVSAGMAAAASSPLPALAGGERSGPDEGTDMPETNDLSGGVPEAREYFLAVKPEEAEFRDASNVWIEEEDGKFGMRIGVERNSSRWDLPEIYLDIAFPDGRVISLRSDEKAHDGAAGELGATVLGGGPLHFEVISPFDEWKVAFNGETAEISAGELIETPYPGLETTQSVSFEITMTMAVPPWVAGEMIPESDRDAFEKDAAGFISPRYEQLFRCQGRMIIGGDETAFKGQGLRIRRQGLRSFGDFPGHVWQSCLFRSGRAFGLNTFGTHDTDPTYAEGFYYDGAGKLIPARLVRVPWMKDLQESGDAIAMVLETGDGEISVGGTTYINCRSRYPSELPPGFPDDYPVIQQSHALYRLGGEEATGMIERSTPPSKLSNYRDWRD